MELADRGDRLIAALVDRALFFAAFLPAVIGMGALWKSNFGQIAGAMGFSVVLMLVLVGYQILLLTDRGQTIGKRWRGIKIVRTQDLANGGFVTNVLLRVGVGWLISMVPFAGLLYQIGDPLFIFRDDRRCLHDLVAGTCVIKA